jgi:hypothetical protein
MTDQVLLPGLPADPTLQEAMLVDLPSKGAIMRRERRHSIMLGSYTWDRAWFHLIDDHAKRGNSWCDARCFARWSYAGERWSEAVRRKTRARMRDLFRTMLAKEDHELFLVIDDSRSELAMRLLQKGDDRDICQAQLDRMERQNEITAERRDQAERLLERMTTPSEP